jgi:hypothetical protein
MSTTVCFSCGLVVPTVDPVQGVCGECVHSLRLTWRRMDEYLDNAGY